MKDRKLVVLTENGRTVVYLLAGIPQGSMKDPFSWICMYDGILRLKLSNGASLTGFVDDLVLMVVAEMIKLDDNSE